MKQPILRTLVRITFLTLIFPLPLVFAQGRLSGYMFGDYYYILSHNIAELKNQNGFWFRRIYFTYDLKFTENWSTRFRLEFNSPGDFKTKDTLKPFVKDAYLAWNKGNHNIFLGISASPTWEYIEGFWGYRSVEKTPLDLYKMGDSRDFGLAFKGSFDKKKYYSYHVMFANGEGTKSEINKGKKFMGSFLFKFAKNFSFEVYGDYTQRESHKNSSTYQGFLGWKGEKSRIGIQYAHQTQQMGKGQKDLAFDIISVFGVVDFSGKTSFLFRYDRMADPLPAASTISYVPMNGSAPFHMFLAGLDLRLIKNISLIPNIMFVSYDKVKGVKPNDDIYFKLTFFYSF